MRFDDLLLRYFGAADLADVAPEAIPPALERMAVDLGLETDRRRRFALWSLMYMLGGAPDLDRAFPDSADREAARNFMDLLSEGE